MLDERKASILCAVVQEYISTGQPVGSAHIVKSAGLQVSSATVRNDMAYLEQEGFLVQPHTSAGRIPTDKGYRYFVDHVAPKGALTQSTKVKVGEFFDMAHGRLEETLQRTSMLLAQLTNYAAEVMGPKTEVATVRSVQLVGLSQHHATFVVVMSNGVVESEPVDLAQTLSDDDIESVTKHLSKMMVGKSLTEIGPLVLSGNKLVDQVSQQVLAAVTTRKVDESVFVGGASAMAEATSPSL